MNDRVRRILQEAGLDHVYDRFLEERIDIETLASLTPEQMSALGVGRLGDQIRLKRVISLHIAEQSPGTAHSPWGSCLERKLYEEEFEVLGLPTETAWERILSLARSLNAVEEERDDLIVVKSRYWGNKLFIGFRRLNVPGRARFAVRIDMPWITWDVARLAEFYVGKQLAALEFDQNIDLDRDPRPTRWHPFARALVSTVAVSGTVMIAVFLWMSFRPGAKGADLGNKVCSCFSDIKDKQDSGEMALGVGNSGESLHGCFRLMAESSNQLRSGSLSEGKNDDLTKFAEAVQKCMP